VQFYVVSNAVEMQQTVPKRGWPEAASVILGHALPRSSLHQIE